MTSFSFLIPMSLRALLLLEILTSAHSSACTPVQFMCPEGYCIAKSWVCDHVMDCQHGEDEQCCPWSPINSCKQDGGKVPAISPVNVSIFSQPSPSTVATTVLSTTSPASTTSMFVTRTATTTSYVNDPTTITTSSSTSAILTVSTATTTSASDALSTTTSRRTTMTSSTSSFTSSSSNSPTGTSATKPISTLTSILSTSWTASVPSATAPPSSSANSTTLKATATTVSPSCPQGTVRCNSDRTCIAVQKVCDNVVNCADYSDESNCDCSERYGFRCQMGYCVNTGAWCDGVKDCPDGTDESSDCSTNCAPNQFKCANNRCVAQSDVCDGLDSCGDESDETNCECTNFEFRCNQTGNCVDISVWCNGIVDCADGSDEPVNCEHNCPIGRLRCDSRCLSDVYVCDGVYNCNDHADESNCNFDPAYLSFSIENEQGLVIATTSNDVQYALCADRWTTNLSDLVCYHHSESCNGSSTWKSRLQQRSTFINNYLTAQSSSELLLQPGLCLSQYTVHLNCSCPIRSPEGDKSVPVCGVWPRQTTSPSLSGSAGNGTRQFSQRHPKQSADWPWQASVMSSLGYLCSAVVIGQEWVLVAAHCLTNAKLLGGTVLANDLTVRVGSLWSSTPTVVSVSDVAIHPLFNISDWTRYDAALLHLSSGLTSSNDAYVAPVCILPTTATFAGLAESANNVVCLVSGLGQLQQPGQPMAANVIHKNVKLHKNDQCAATTTSSVICGTVDNDGFASLCASDNGNPLICQQADGTWTLVGLLSTAAQTNVTFSSVADVYPWIKRVTGLQ